MNIEKIYNKILKGQIIIDNLNLQENDGEKLLQLSIYKENLDIVKSLVKLKFNPFSRDENGMNSFMYAASASNVEILEILLSAYNYKLTEEDRAEMLVCAVSNDVINNVEFMLGHGFNAKGVYRDDPIICWAAQSGTAEIIKLLVEKGAPLNSCNSDSQTVLFILAANGESQLVNWVLKLNVEIDEADFTGCTPLMISCCYGHVKIAKALISAGANINKRDHDGVSPILYSIQYGNIQIVELLLERGADTNIQDIDGGGVFDYLLKIDDLALRQDMMVLLRNTCSSNLE